MNENTLKNFNTIKTLFEASNEELQIAMELKSMISPKEETILILSATILASALHFNDAAHDLFREITKNNVKTNFSKKEIILENQKLIFRSIDSLKDIKTNKFKRIIFMNK